MKIIKENIPFTMVANEILCRRDISLKAKGLYAYLFSKPNGWEFAASRISKECKEERKTILKLLQELESLKLLDRCKLATGKVEYNLKYSDSQSTTIGLRKGKARVQEWHRGEMGLLSNKEEESNKEGGAKTLPVPQGKKIIVVPNEEIVSIIDSFGKVNPTVYRQWYQNANQRGAIKRLILIHTFEVLRDVVKTLPAINQLPYIKSAHTPLELESRWSAIQDGIAKEEKIRKAKQGDKKGVDI